MVSFCVCLGCLSMECVSVALLSPLFCPHSPPPKSLDAVAPTGSCLAPPYTYQQCLYQVLLPAEGPPACGSALPGHTVLRGSQGVAWKGLGSLVWAACCSAQDPSSERCQGCGLPTTPTPGSKMKEPQPASSSSHSGRGDP